MNSAPTAIGWKARTPAALADHMVNRERFVLALTDAYTDLFVNDASYAFSAARTTPANLAVKMTNGLMSGDANKDGEGIKRACKAVGIAHTYKAIRAFLAS